MGGGKELKAREEEDENKGEDLAKGPRLGRRVNVRSEGPASGGRRAGHRRRADGPPREAENGVEAMVGGGIHGLFEL